MRKNYVDVRRGRKVEGEKNMGSKGRRWFKGRSLDHRGGGVGGWGDYTYHQVFKFHKK